MTKLITTISMLFALVFAPFAIRTLPAQETAEHNTIVNEIKVIVKGVPKGTIFDEKNLVSRLKTKQGCVFNHIDFDNDLKALAQEFDRVEPRLEYNGSNISITLELSIKPVIRKIVWKGNSKIGRSDLETELSIAAGTVYEHHSFNEAFHKIKALYVKKGYFEANLTYQIYPIPDSNEIDIVISIAEGHAGKIKKINFKGLSKEEENEIIDRMFIKEYNFFLSWINDTGIHNKEALEQDRLVILNYLQNEGYADAKVDISIANCKNADAIEISICAQKGERYYFGDLCICGHNVVSSDDIFKYFCIRKGEVYSPDKVRETIRAIQDYYGSKGYVEAVVVHRPELQECQNVYNIRFDILEGEPYRVGLVKIFGNTCTNTRVILHESLLTPGDIFDVRKLKATETRLQMIGYFKCVNVYPVKSSLNSEVCGNYRDVHIEVEETTTGNIGLFGGYSSVDSLFTGIELTENNFNYKGLFSLFSRGPGGLRGNGEFFQLRTSIGTKATSYTLRWAQPYFMDTPWVVGFDAERAFNRAVSRDYDIETLTFKLHATYPINRFLRFTWHYRYQNSQTHVTGQFNETERENTPANQLRQLSQQEQEASRHGVVSALGPALSYDSTNRIHNPSKGLRSTLSMEYAGLGGDYHFLSFAYLNTLYYPIGSCGVFKYRWDARFIQPVGHTTARELPLGERYFLGGEDSVRGYRNFAIGPQFNNGDPEGGISSVLLSQEYQHHLFSRVDAFAFFDAGSVSLNPFQIGPLRCSYGIGLRVEAMENMPITFGMGWPINPKRHQDVKRFFFSLGGRF